MAGHTIIYVPCGVTNIILLPETHDDPICNLCCVCGRNYIASAIGTRIHHQFVMQTITSSVNIVRFRFQTTGQF
jgi:hypothetical protein